MVATRPLEGDKQENIFQVPVDDREPTAKEGDTGRHPKGGDPEETLMDVPAPKAPDAIDPEQLEIVRNTADMVLRTAVGSRSEVMKDRSLFKFVVIKVLAIVREVREMTDRSTKSAR